jgi:hypothetical protein
VTILKTVVLKPLPLKLDQYSNSPLLPVLLSARLLFVFRAPPVRGKYLALKSGILAASKVPEVILEAAKFGISLAAKLAPAVTKPSAS